MIDRQYAGRVATASHCVAYVCTVITLGTVQVYITPVSQSVSDCSAVQGAIAEWARARCSAVWRLVNIQQAAAASKQPSDRPIYPSVGHAAAAHSRLCRVKRATICRPWPPLQPHEPIANGRRLAEAPVLRRILADRPTDQRTIPASPLCCRPRSVRALPAHSLRTSTV